MEPTSQVLLKLETYVVFVFQLDDAALQLYKDGDYGAYLDLDASITELQDEFDNFQVK